MRRVWPFFAGALLWHGMALASDYGESGDESSDDEAEHADEDRKDEDRADDQSREDDDYGDHGEEEHEGPRKPKRKPSALGKSGAFVVSLERTVGFSYTSTVVKLDGPDEKTRYQRLSLLLNPNGADIGYSAPRVAFDYFVADGFSLGAAVGYGATSKDAHLKLFLGQPRLGYALLFTRMVGIWPKLGASFVSIDADRTKIGSLALSGELPLVIAPAPNLVFSLAPSFDAGLVAKIDPPGKGNKKDYVLDEIGIWANVSVVF